MLLNDVTVKDISKRSPPSRLATSHPRHVISLTSVRQVLSFANADPGHPEAESASLPGGKDVSIYDGFHSDLAVHSKPFTSRAHLIYAQAVSWIS